MRRETQAAETLTVGQVARRFGVTVRTLHHYDAVGLLVPSGRSPAGYRLYTPGDLARLRTIVVYRRLGFPLEEVAQLLAGDADLAGHLRRQRATITARLEEMRGLVQALDRALEAEMSDEPAAPADLTAIFGAEFRDEYQDEARERWGGTPAWEQSAQRARGYRAADWAQIKAESDAIEQRFADLLRAGVAPTSEEAMAVAESHRLLIARRFYELDHAFHRNLAELYVTDPRFASHYDDQCPGLARYVHDAVQANADRHVGTTPPDPT